MIQAVITRMGRNPFLVRGWSITLVAVLFALPAAGTVVVADLVEAGREDGLYGQLAQSADDQRASAGRLQLGENRRPAAQGPRPVTSPVGPVTQTTYSHVHATTPLASRPLRALSNGSPLRQIRAGTAAIRSRHNG